MRTIFKKNSDYGVWDRAGVMLSLICALHCLLTPFVILSLPILARYYLASPVFHLALALLIVPVGIYSFVNGYKHHHKLKPLLLGIPGIFFVSRTPYLVHVQGLGLPEQLAMVVGSCLLISAHLINQKSCRKCKHH